MWQRLKAKGVGRAKSFESDFTALLLSLASSIRTGMDPLAALLKASDLFPERSVLRGEIEKVKEAVEAGKISRLRYENYRQLYQELKEQKKY